MTKEALEDFCDVIVKPVADGGEGSVEAIKELKECEFLVACDVVIHSTDKRVQPTSMLHKRAQMVAW